MKTTKRIFSIVIALVLAFTMTFSGFATVGVEKDADTYVSISGVEKIFWNIIEDVAETLVKAIAHFVPTPAEWNDDTSFAEGFMKGTEEFATQSGDTWSLGYDSRSIMLSEEETIDKLYVGGTIAFGNKTATEIVDDLKVRTVALNDSTGRGTAVFAVVDAYGLALSDVREIRVRLQQFAEENGINSITVSVLHQHSAVDTFGMNGNIVEMVLFNPAMTFFGMETENGKNDKYMENLYNKCTDSIKAAVEDMTEGKLYLGTADASKYTYDKRQPYVNDPNFNRLRFVPADGSKETWIVTSPIHCVGNGAAGTAITGDYPYYAEQAVADKANLVFVLGAEQSNTQERNEDNVPGYKEGMDRLEEMALYGKAIGNDIAAITDETEVSPLLNIRYTETYLTVANPILLLAGKAGLFENIIRNVDGEYKVLTEVGYLEIGDDLAFAVVPGELAPELAYGGCLSGEYSWSGKDWEYPSMQEIVTNAGIDRELYVLGLANDQVGYIVPDNDYIPMIHEASGSIEFVSLGENTASNLVKAFEQVVAG